MIKVTRVKIANCVYIKHTRHMDVAIKLTADIVRTGNTYVVYGKYVNQGYVETFDLGTPVRLTIHESKFSDWLICRNPSEPSIRKSKWFIITPRSKNDY